MQIHVSPRHLVLTAAIHGYVAEKIEHLESYTSRILAAHVVLVHDETKKKRYTAKAHIAMNGVADIFAEDTETDLYVAIDSVTNKIIRQLRKRKTNLVTRRKHKAQLAKEEEKRGFSRR